MGSEKLIRLDSVNKQVEFGWLPASFAKLTNNAELDHYLKSEFKDLVPYRKVFRGIINIDRGKFQQFVNIDFPENCASLLNNQFSLKTCVKLQTLRKWLSSFATIKLTPDIIKSGIVTGCDELFDSAGVKAALVSGIPDFDLGRASIFCFAGDLDLLQKQYCDTIDAVTPYFHRVMVRQESLRSLENREKNDSLLTRREIEMLELIYEGFEYQDIANSVGISVNTVRAHLKNIFLKFQVSNRTQALVKAINSGVLNT